MQISMRLRDYYINKMEYKQKTTNKPSKYAKIPLSKRLTLVEEVFTKKHSISKSAKKLNIKSSTAKLIIKKYKKEGVFFEKQSDRLARLTQKQEKIECTDPPEINKVPDAPEAYPQSNHTFGATYQFERDGIRNSSFVTRGEELFNGVYSQLNFGNIYSVFAVSAALANSLFCDPSSIRLFL